jgi:hypothetical protein
MKHLYAAAKLLESFGEGEIGVSIFVNAMPHDIPIGIMLRDPLHGAEIDGGQPDFFGHEFQIIVNDGDPERAYDIAKRASEVLKVRDLQADGVFIREMYPLTLPAPYPRMDNDKIETLVRMRVWFSIA